MPRDLHFSLRCPRCHRNRTFSIEKDYSSSASFVLKCQGFNGKCKFVAKIKLQYIPDWYLEATRSDYHA